MFTAFNPVQAQIVSTRLQTAGLDATVEGEAAALSMEGTRLPPGDSRAGSVRAGNRGFRLIEADEENES